jgi:ribosomal-protein-alanine N-acetyltransferase
MENQSQIITQRFILKSITPNVIKKLFKEKIEAQIKAFFETDQNGFDRLKRMYEKGMETYNISFLYFLICDKESDKVVGECGFHTWNKTHKRTELFYNLKNDLDKRKGIMSEVLFKVLDFGFKELDFHRIEALTANENIASIKLLERFGFTKEGTMREDYIVDGENVNSECYFLLKWEWTEGNKIN